MKRNDNTFTYYSTLKLSPNEELFTCKANNGSYIFDSETGEELYRTSNNNMIFFDDDNLHYWQLDTENTKLIQYDLISHDVVDEKILNSPPIDGFIYMGDKSRIFAQSGESLLVIDIDSGEIIARRDFEKNSSTQSGGFGYLTEACDGTLMAKHTRADSIGVTIGMPEIITRSYNNRIFLDPNTLDSLYIIEDGVKSVFSNDCEYLASITAQPISDDKGISIFKNEVGRYTFDRYVNIQQLNTTSLKYDKSNYLVVGRNNNSGVFFYDSNEYTLSKHYGATIIEAFDISYDGFFYYPLASRVIKRDFREIYSISEISNSSNSIYPNPTNSLLNIKTKNVIDRFELYSIQGEFISELPFKYHFDYFTIDLTEYAIGQYIIKGHSRNEIKNYFVTIRR
ncbi:MAG: hypothetical protein Kapaf2KO_02770 [Candidatus Kapaibacteriales bacterium]